MSDLQKTEELTTEVAASRDWATLVASSMSLDDLKPQINVSSEYIELNKVGDTFRGVYVGETSANVADKQTGELKQLRAARFLINGAMYINAGVVLVDEIAKAGIPSGTPVEVAYTAKKNNTKIYSVTLLG